MAEESFPLPGSSFKQLEKIITSYAEIKIETGPDEVAKLAGTDGTNVSRNNKFLVATGLVEGKQKKKITPLGEKLARSIQYQQGDTEKESWAEIVEKTEFLQKLISAVKIRRGMDASSLTNHIAFSAGAPKNAQMMAGAGAVLEILIRSGALSEQGGILLASDATIPSANKEKPANPFSSKPKFYGGGDIFQPYTASGALYSERTNAEAVVKKSDVVRLNIDVKINCTVADLDTLGEKLRKLLADLHSQGSLQGVETKFEVSPVVTEQGGQ